MYQWGISTHSQQATKRRFWSNSSNTGQLLSGLINIFHVHKRPNFWTTPISFAKLLKLPRSIPSILNVTTRLSGQCKKKKKTCTCIHNIAKLNSRYNELNMNWRFERNDSTSNRQFRYRYWNKNADSHSSFKSALKTFLFRKSCFEL